MNESRSNFVIPIRKTVDVIVLKLLSGTNLTFKVDRFDAFVNRSSIADFMIMKTSR